MISLTKICKSYQLGERELKVLKAIDLTIEEGDFVAIEGVSGSGKSTLLNILGLLDQYDEGHYELAGITIDENIKEKKAAVLRNQLIGFVFQSFNLIRYKNALENVALPLYYRGIKKKKREAIALEYLTKVGLKDWARHLPKELSGGQQQRVAIARALSTNPKIILADEPTGALDSKTTEEVINLLTEINHRGKTVVVITHENEVAQRTKRIVRLSDGVIVSDKKNNR